MAPALVVLLLLLLLQLLLILQVAVVLVPQLNKYERCTHTATLTDEPSTQVIIITNKRDKDASCPALTGGMRRCMRSHQAASVKTPVWVAEWSVGATMPQSATLLSTFTLETACACLVCYCVCGVCALHGWPQCTEQSWGARKVKMVKYQHADAAAGFAFRLLLRLKLDTTLDSTYR